MNVSLANNFRTKCSDVAGYILVRRPDKFIQDFQYSNTEHSLCFWSDFLVEEHLRSIFNEV